MPLLTCRVPVLRSYRTYRSVGYWCWGPTEHTEASVTVSSSYRTIPKTSVGYLPSKYPRYTLVRMIPYRMHLWIYCFYLCLLLPETECDWLVAPDLVFGSFWKNARHRPQFGPILLSCCILWRDASTVILYWVRSTRFPSGTCLRDGRKN